METLNLKSNDLFLRYGGKENVFVYKLTAQHSSTVKLDDWEYQYSVGADSQNTYQSFKIFGHSIKGENLKKLASDLHQSRLLINREGYCYLDSEIVDTPGSRARSLSHVEYYRLNDLFVWSDYGVTSFEITTVWDRRDLKSGSTINNIVDVSDEIKKERDELKRKLDAKEKELSDSRTNNDKLKRELDDAKTTLQATNDAKTTLQATNDKLKRDLDDAKTTSQANNDKSKRGFDDASFRPSTPPPPPHSSSSGTGRYPFPLEETSQIHRSCQKMKPGHFMFQVESYQDLKKSLEEAKCHEFESPEFDVGDFKWVLSLYFRGNPLDYGSAGHISMYLKKRRNPKQRSENIKLLVRFFIYNHIHREYLTIQDLEVKEFDDQMNREAGVAQAIKINDFEEQTNGFLRGAQCRFGVEVILVKSSPHTAEISLEDNLEHRFGLCDFTPYSELPKKGLTISQNHFVIDQYPWKVQIYPRGRGKWEYRSVSVFLQLIDTTMVSNGEHLFVDFKLSLKDKSFPNPKENYSKRRVAWFTETQCIHGFEDFIRLSELTSNFTVGDCVTIEVYFNQLFKLKDI